VGARERHVEGGQLANIEWASGSQIAPLHPILEVVDSRESVGVSVVEDNGVSSLVVGSRHEDEPLVGTPLDIPDSPR
jgi:hypothetical protein